MATMEESNTTTLEDADEFDAWEPVDGGDSDLSKQIGETNLGDELLNKETSPVSNDETNVSKDLTIDTDINKTIPSEHSSPSFINNMISSFKLRSATSPANAVASPTDSIKNQPISSPSIISHRRNTSMSSIQRRNTSTSSNASTTTTAHEKELTPLEPDFDTKRFMENKYMDTEYHLASITRNVDFHKIFQRSSDDKLIDDFSCALSKDFLYQGRLYVSEFNLCFISNILGWKSKIVEIPFKRVTYIEKTSTGGLFPNAISIETKNDKFQFNNFISRDKCFDLIKEVWSRNLLAKEEEGDEDDSSSESEEELEKEISMTDFSDQNISSSLADKSKLINCFQFKTSSPFYDENETIQSSETLLPELNKNESIIFQTTLNCTPMQAYKIIFNDSDFLNEFIESLDGSNIDIPTEPFNLENPVRNYSYDKALKYPAGPKSTKCIVSDEIIQLSSRETIVVVNSTRTPDVPSGNSFTTKLKYIFRWNNENKCEFSVGFWVEWTGSSWIKSMVENGGRNGSIDACNILLEVLNKYIDSYIEVLGLEGKENIPSAQSITEKPVSSTTDTGVKITENITTRLLLFVIVLLLLLNGYNQVKLQRTINKLVLKVNDL
ncbi:hypothetical protein KAFR_0C03620 [Kazachstania africana CBS 2517]|uniref:VASt domain-containing protein n=1 Tax=Kazachstania africana (strain ATCC 22294 / BCRC 22015 / CBS 2517 / CECT 1963 / NBRC 1671 / NRRL Y-8276) TaxID=1071382 RepID=H2ASK4_KAZAF|nr:hypothetical protein KAFR_0C03620 [Kazachstania africana CBS 2517]CCF57354.1 hypothetical protein KAFR_0C03620 [Kazachstania africana CBS 2517]